MNFLGPYKSLVLGILFALLGGLLYLWCGLDASISRDQGLYLYASREIAYGIPPYLSIFDIKPPAGPLVFSLPAMFSEKLSWDLLTSIRLFSIMIGFTLLLGIFIYTLLLTGQLFAAIMATVLVPSVYRLTAEIVAGGQSKVIFVFFQVMTLVAVCQRHFIIAGASAALCALTWQPGGIVLLGVALGIICQRSFPKTAALSQVAFGAAVPVALAFIYFWSKDALAEFFDGSLLMPLEHGHRIQAPQSFLARVVFRFAVFFNGFMVASVPLLLGSVAFVVFSLQSIQAKTPGQSSVSEIAALVIFGLFLIWSTLDLQGPPDLFVFVPFAAAGFGILSALGVQGLSHRGQAHRVPQGLIASLLVMACALSWGYVHAEFRRSRAGLEWQEGTVARISQLIGPDAKVIALGAPEFFLLSGRRSPTQFLIIESGIDDYIDATHEGGFVGWIEQLADYEADAIVLGKLLGRRVGMLQTWIGEHYEEVPPARWSYVPEERRSLWRYIPEEQRWSLWVRRRDPGVPVPSQ